MCMITDATKINGNWFLNCTKYDGDFLGANTLKITDDKHHKFETHDFDVDVTKSCFSGGGLPWVRLGSSVPETFLRIGNDVVFE
ncbi:hypothetical protein FACS1894133_7500 [Clostridia bacterium]|nr:hypothetical protein FACS1894133_7500 [Clostridia bacterium]